jgi:hypothetical protein
MCRKFPWTRIDPLFHGFQYLTEKDIIFYHLEYYSRGGYQMSPAPVISGTDLKMS